MAQAKATCTAAILLAAVTTAAAAQTDAQEAQADEVTQEEIERADIAAGRMYTGTYGMTVPTYMTVGEAIERLREMGYTGISDVDIEWNHYEIEAYAPNGNEVEIEFDPATGAILDVEDNWF